MKGSDGHSPIWRRFSCTLACVAAVAVFAGLAPSALAAPTIRFKGNGLDRFKFHGRVKLDPPWEGGPIDPLTAAFGVELRNELGLIYQGTILPGDLQPIRGDRYLFRDRAAADGNGSRDGLFMILTRYRKFSDGWWYTVRIRAFADLSAATEPLMTVIFNEVDGNAGVTAEWVPTQFGWRLPLNRF